MGTPPFNTKEWYPAMFFSTDAVWRNPKRRKERWKLLPSVKTSTHHYCHTFLSDKLPLFADVSTKKRTVCRAAQILKIHGLGGSLSVCFEMTTSIQHSIAVSRAQSRGCLPRLTELRTVCYYKEALRKQKTRILLHLITTNPLFFWNLKKTRNDTNIIITYASDWIAAKFNL